MNKFNAYALTCLLLLGAATVFPQSRGGRVQIVSEAGSNTFEHTIERGETVYAIATMYGVSVDDIYRLNPESKTGIKAGDKLRIPQKDAATQTASSKKAGDYLYHAIKRGETLYALSQEYDIPAQAILDANPGLSVSTFAAGRIIRIPPPQIEDLPTTEQKETVKEIEYVVEKRETLYRICRKFNISSVELIKHNPKLKNGVKAGMVLKIPTKTTEVVTTTPADSRPMRENEVNALLYEKKESLPVDRIKVGLLLPFKADKPTRDAATARFVEYYEGMLLAVDSLRKQGVSIELSVYDTGEGARAMNQILETEENLRSANLLIGAVQNDQIGPLADFAQKHKIKYVIPFTSKNDDVLSNASVFQVNTPHSYLYSKAAQAGCDLFADHNIVIVNIKDKDEKTDFIKAFKEEMKSRGIAHKELTYNAATFTTDIEALLIRDKRNVVLPTSASLDAVNKIKTPLRMLAETQPEVEEGEEPKPPFMITLFGYPEWQTYVRECLEDFYMLNTYIYSNFYADNLSNEVHDFYGKYKDWYSKDLINTFPKYGILGFDTGMFFLGALQKYGTNFENNLDKIHYKCIQTGFDFHRVNNWGGFINTNIFMVHYKNDYTVTRTEVRWD